MTSNHNGHGGYRELPFSFSLTSDGPDISGLDAIQARQTQELVNKMDKQLRDSLQQYVGLPNDALGRQAAADKMNATLAEMAREDETKRIMGIDVSDEILRSIDPKRLIARTFEVCSYEAIMASVIEKLNRQPTSGAINRSLEFLMSTTHPVASQEDYDYEEYQAAMAKLDAKPRHEKEIEMLMNELSQLIFVSKARLILNDYPENVSISVQMSPSIQEDEADVAMQAFENVLVSMKPKGLIELEVSITNKVVY